METSSPGNDAIAVGDADDPAAGVRNVLKATPLAPAGGPIDVCWHHGTDLRAVTGLRLPMTVAGTHSLHVGVVDAAGCSDETAQSRPVVVR